MTVKVDGESDLEVKFAPTQLERVTYCLYKRSVRGRQSLTAF
jgi:hypothetical protein